MYAKEVEYSNQCLSEEAMEHLQSFSVLLETTEKEKFFLQLARALQDLNHLQHHVREHCAVNQLARDLITFCRSECEPKKVMSRFAVNMTPIGQQYTELLSTLYSHEETTNLRQEVALYGRVGEAVGRIVRVALSFDLFDRMSGKYAELLEDDDDFLD